VIFSNCDHLKLYIDDRIIEADPDRADFPNLPHPPFQVELRRVPHGDLRIEGYLHGNKVIEKQYSGKGVDQEFVLAPDDTTLVANGADATRVVFHVTDEYGSLRRYSTAAIAFDLQGPAEIIGDNPSTLMGGCGAIWLRAKNEAGTARLKATHPALGPKEIEIQIKPVEAERV